MPVNLTISLWQDNIASDSDSTVMDSVSRKHKGDSSHVYPCPPAIAENKKKMGGVDNNNQLRGLLSCTPEVKVANVMVNTIYLWLCQNTCVHFLGDFFLIVSLQWNNTMFMLIERMI